MKAVITIDMDNAAFEVEDEDGEGTSPNLASGHELARVLRRLAAGVEDVTLEPGDTTDARDTNGNTVAQMEVSA